MRRLSKISIICNENLGGIQIAKENNIKFEKKNDAESKKNIIKIGILNLMPIKDEAESQYFTILGRYHQRVEIEFLYPDNHISKNTSNSYIKENYIPLSLLKERNYNGIIITGAPLEEIEFEEVTYWNDLDEIFNLEIPSIYICWASQGALYKHYGIKKYKLEEKIFGVFNHKVYPNEFIKLNEFMAPHSRNTMNKKVDLEKVGLKIISENEKAGVYMASTNDYMRFYIPGHGEYQKERLDIEYKRDLKNIPENYYKDDNPQGEILFTWDEHRKIFYKNWLEFINSRR